MSTNFNRKILKIDAAVTSERLAAIIKRQILQILKKSGAVIGISGGVDSSVTTALCVRALEKHRVLGVIMPEKESATESKSLAIKMADHLGIEYIVDPVSSVLEGFGCYHLRNEAIRKIFPEFTDEHKAKMTIASDVLERGGLNFFKLTIESPDGKTRSTRMPAAEYLQIVAASNFKQRARMARLYYHAERLNRAVVGTGNKDEHELGFFVKQGDGGTDIKPIAHLYKTQVYQLAEYLDIPKEIVSRVPTTDTYSAEVSQTEFFFGIDFDLLDLIWYGLEHDLPATEVAAELNLTPQQVERVYKDIRQKQRATEYLRLPPLKADT